MWKKIITLSLCIVTSTASLYSQELRIGVDYLSKIKIENLSSVQEELLQNLIEDALGDVIGATRTLSWNDSFTIVAKSKINEILQEQKIQEDLSECTDESCAITLGKLVSAKYMIYRDIGEYRPGEYNFRFSLINIETGTVVASSNIFYKGDILEGESIKSTFFDLMATLFNEAFWYENRIPKFNTEEPQIIEKKGPNLLLILLGVLLLGAAAAGGGGSGGSGGSGTGGVDIGIDIP